MIAKPFYIAWFLIAGLAVGLACGDAVKPSQKPVRAKPKVIDLDFTDDDDDSPAPQSRSRLGSGAADRQWIYWSVGASVLAGGVGWYILEERQKDPIVTRNEQVFTDERQ
jgi:hypothetical protein